MSVGLTFPRTADTPHYLDTLQFCVENGELVVQVADESNREKARFRMPPPDRFLALLTHIVELEK